MNRTLEQIEADIEKTNESYDKKFHDGTHHKWEEFEAYARPEMTRLGELSRERRMAMPYELDEIPDYADVMPLKQFIECVKDGWFIDYDGFGYYILNGKETNITIIPSDIEYGAIRWEFDSVAWYNR